MSMQVYRELMGVGTDDEMAASLKAIDEAIAELNAGRGIPLDEVKRRLDLKYGVYVKPQRNLDPFGDFFREITP